MKDYDKNKIYDGQYVIPEKTAWQKFIDRFFGRRRKNKFMQQRLGKLYALFGTLIFATATGLCSYFGVFSNADYVLSDHIFKWMSAEDEDKSHVTIIAIDDTTAAEYGKYESWSRSRLAELLDKLEGSKHYKPLAIGISLDLSAQKTDGGDEKLVDVCKKYDNICVAVVRKSHTDAPSGKPSEKPAENPKPSTSVSASREINSKERSRSLSFPYEALRPYITPGYMSMTNNINSLIREFSKGENIDGTDYDSFAISVYKKFLNGQNKTYTAPATDKNNNFSLNYLLNTEEKNIYSFYDVMEGTINPKVFKDSIILIADYTNIAANNEVGRTSMGGKRLTVIEVQANEIDALAAQRTGHSVSKTVMAVLYALFIALFFFVTAYSTNTHFLLEGIFVVLALVITCGVMNLMGYYMLILIPVIFLILITILNLLNRYALLWKSKHQMETVLNRYMDKNIVNEIVSEGEIAVRIGGLKKDIAVLFVDIRGFTSLSESMDPEKIVRILNRYLSLVSEAVSKNQGTLDKFIGDAAMAVFNSPFNLKHYEYHAACAAWDIKESAVELNEMCEREYGKKVNFGIGIHCGEAVIGNIGSELRMDYTAIGDTVNTAARLESSALAGQILISEEMKNRLGVSVETSFIGEYTLKGKKKTVPVYSLDKIEKQQEETTATTAPVERIISRAGG